MKNVVIVESPAKARTIEKFLGAGYSVVASYGHIRDLPKSKLGIDTEHDFEPQYLIPRGAQKHLKALKTAVGTADQVYLATDFDREGEAIAWHITQAIEPKSNQQVSRITFTEITADAIRDSIKHSRDIDIDLVDAQQARRLLDRLVGYLLSPILWKKVKSGLSAGRVQSVALKLVVDRERAIADFTPQEYWSIQASLDTVKPESFLAMLTKIGEQKSEIADESTARKIEDDLNKLPFSVKSVDQKETSRRPAPPFITSSLQQEAGRKFGFTAKRTMMIAQQLYEGIDIGSGSTGLISYMRTDSYNLSNEALTQATQVIGELFGAKYTTGPRYYKKKVRGAQEAHEAIRPTDLKRTPESLKEYLNTEQMKVYRLIWQRTLASQMLDAKYLQKGADITAGKYLFRATGRTTIFDGFTRLYQEGQDDDSTEEPENKLPDLAPNDKLNLKELLPEQHFTSPPPRYTEASLIKQLEENGIGRPSTYAPTISTLLDRGYITKDAQRLVAQNIGFLVIDLLAQHFPFVVDEKFTAGMEDQLDEIAEGHAKWKPMIKAFYEDLSRQISSETDKIEKVKPPEIPTDEKCDVCGRPMVIKTGRFGEFLACSGFPECKNTKTIIKTIGIKCPEDGGEVIEKRTKRGKVFYGCSNYPKCNFATWTKPAEAK